MTVDILSVIQDKRQNILKKMTSLAKKPIVSLSEYHELNNELNDCFDCDACNYKKQCSKLYDRISEHVESTADCKYRVLDPKVPKIKSIILSCDRCGKTFAKPLHELKDYRHHYCSQLCAWSNRRWISRRQHWAKLARERGE